MLESTAPSPSEGVPFDRRETRGAALLSFNPKLEKKKKSLTFFFFFNSLTQSSGLQIRNQIQPRLGETPHEEGWR